MENISVKPPPPTHFFFSKQLSSSVLHKAKQNSKLSWNLTLKFWHPSKGKLMELKVMWIEMRSMVQHTLHLSSSAGMFAHSLIQCNAFPHCIRRTQWPRVLDSKNQAPAQEKKWVSGSGKEKKKCSRLTLNCWTSKRWEEQYWTARRGGEETRDRSGGWE